MSLEFKVLRLKHYSIWTLCSLPHMRSFSWTTFGTSCKYQEIIFHFAISLSLEQFSIEVNLMSKVNRDCIGFPLLRSVIGLENSRHFFNQSHAKLKPIVPWSLVFSRAWGYLHVFTLSSHWLLVMLIFAPIGHCNYFGFGFTTLSWKAL